MNEWPKGIKVNVNHRKRPHKGLIFEKVADAAFSYSRGNPILRLSSLRTYEPRVFFHCRHRRDVATLLTSICCPLSPLP